MLLTTLLWSDISQEFDAVAGFTHSSFPAMRGGQRFAIVNRPCLLHIRQLQFDELCKHMQHMQRMPPWLLRVALDH